MDVIVPAADTPWVSSRFRSVSKCFSLRVAEAPALHPTPPPAPRPPPIPALRAVVMRHTSQLLPASISASCEGAGRCLYAPMRERAFDDEEADLAAAMASSP